MRNIVLFLITFVLSIQLLGQSRADELYQAGYFKEAIVLYKNALPKQKEDVQLETKLKIAEAYFNMNNYLESLSSYTDLYKSGNKDSLVLVRLIQLNRNFCNYEAAKDYFSAFKSYLPKQITSEAYVSDNFDFPLTNTTTQNIEINPIAEALITKGMGFTFFQDDFLIVGTSRENKEDKTTFYELNKFKEVEGTAVVEELGIKSTNYFQAYPSYDASNGYLYYTANISDRKKQNRKITSNVLQIYRVKIQNNSISEPELLSFNESEYNFTHPSISKDGNTLYFISDRPGGMGGLDIYYVTKNGDDWSAPVNCGERVNTPFNELSPFIFGDSLFFSSYGHQNYGGSDIFLSVKKDGAFQLPENLGLPINSCKDDFSYQFQAGSDYAYFMSNRNAESGEVDNLFKAILAKEVFKVRDEITGLPIEGVKVRMNNEEVFLTNNDGEWKARIPEGASFDLVIDHPEYELVEKSFEAFNEEDRKWLSDVVLAPVVIKGRLTDAITNKPIDDADVQFFEKDDEGVWRLTKANQTDKDGNWSQTISRNKSYKIVFSKDSYIEDNVIFDSFEDLGEMKSELLQRLNPYQMPLKAEKDVVINIDNIYFDFDKATLRQESFEILDNLKKYLEANPDIKIELSAHTDCIGNERYNMRLSRKRADACKIYLLNKGINANRITAVGYGQTKPLIDCRIQRRDAEAAQKNRRVEVKIL